MRTPVKLRTLTAEEVTVVKRLASSRKEPIRLVQRARIIAYMLEDSSLCASDAGFGFVASMRKALQDSKTNHVQGASPLIARKFTVNW